MPTLSPHIRSTIRLDPIGWASSCGINLRPYQREIVLAIKDSIVKEKGHTFVVILPHQSCKNELQAHLFAWLLFRCRESGGLIVSVSPTYKPQTLNNMDRVRQILQTCLGSRGRWNPSGGYMYAFGKARLQFFSGETSANVVGATANRLLSVDEAQDINPAKFDKDFDPMTASTNATRVFWGTAWTEDTLLERMRKQAVRDQEKDGIQCFFFYTADEIRKYVPAYGRTVDRVIAEKGRNHPLVRTQYFCETIEAQSGMFNPGRMALIFQVDREKVIRDQVIREKVNSEEVNSEEPEITGWRFVEGGEEYAGPVVRKVTVDLGELGRWSIPPGPHEETGPGQVESFHATDGRPLERTGEAREEAAQTDGAGAPAPSSAPSSNNTPSLNPKSEIGNQKSKIINQQCYVFLIDVAGMDEARINTNQALMGDGLGNPGRDSTTVTVVEVDLSSLETLQRPTYRVEERKCWTGENHLTVFGHIKALAKKWAPQHIVIDATGVGEGLWAMLERAFPTRVIPVKFSSQEKSEIGWRFLSIIETGRFQDPLTAASQDKLSDAVRLQYSRCICEILPGPAKSLRWGVPDGARGPDGELVHDDFIMADALTAKLDQLEWQIHFKTVMLSSPIDPLKEMEGNY